MHQQALFRVSTARLCIFCASRLYGDIAALPAAVQQFSSAPRRRLSTARVQCQSIQAVEVCAEDDAQQGFVEDHRWAASGYSNLTPAEQRAKLSRQRLQHQQEEQRRRPVGPVIIRRQFVGQNEMPRDSRTTANKIAYHNNGRQSRRPNENRTQGNLRHEPEEAGRSDGRKGILNNSSGTRPVNLHNDSATQYNRGKLPKAEVEPIAAPVFQTLNSSKGSEGQSNSGWGAGSGERRSLELNNSNALPSLKISQREPGNTKQVFTPLVSSNPLKNDYKVLPFDSSEFPRHRPRDTGDQPTHWRITLPKDNAFATQRDPEQPDQRLPNDLGREKVPNDETIEARFDQHRAGRVKTSFGKRSNTHFRHQQENRGQAMLSGARCARCLEYGHRADSCQSPPKMACFKCGQPGHIAKSCPERTVHPGVPRMSRSPARNAEDNITFRGRVDVSRREFIYDSRTKSRQGGIDDSPLNQRLGRFTSSQENSITEQQDLDSEPRERRERMSRWEDADDAGLVRQTPSRRELKKSRGRPRRDELAEEEDDEAAAAREAKAAQKATRRAEKEQRAREAMTGRLDAGGSRIELPEFVSVSNLAQMLGIRYEAFVARLADFGYDDIFPGMVLNSEISGMIAMEYNFEPVFESTSTVAEEEERDLKPQPDHADKSALSSRPPVVTIMGHVDHGKTTILDYLRQSSVAAGEAGGITQHIGAFSVPLTASGKTITFLDTPGHAAFLAMRQRGANVTDIVVLVVAADDSVKPQTLEALRHARDANVPIIVAISKIDKAEADVERVKHDLARHGIEIEDFGGETQVVPVSGKTGQGLRELEEAIVTLSEILDYRAPTDGAVEGWVLEATTSKAGRVATVLVRRGTLKPGMIVVAGKTWARVRALRNEAGQSVQQAGPGTPIEIDGWRDQPAAGDEMIEAPSEQKATSVVGYRIEKKERKKVAKDMEAINEVRRLEHQRRSQDKQSLSTGDDTGPNTSTALHEGADQASGQTSVPFIIKADVSGSAEAVAAYIMSTSTPLIAPRVLAAQVGGVYESDIELAATVNGHIISFNNPPNDGIKAQAAANGVQIIENNIIYRIVEDVQSLLEDKLPPVITQRVVGEAEVSALFDIKLSGRKTIKIAGCKVRNGMIKKGSRVRVLRGNEKVHDGLLNSLKNVKKDVQEMRKGTECGIGIEDWEGFEIGDQLQTYEEVSEKRKLFS